MGDHLRIADILIRNSSSNLAILVEADPKAPFSIATTSQCREGRYSIPRIAPLYLWSSPYSTESQVLSKAASSTIFWVWYDSTWDWTPVSQTISEHSTHLEIIYFKTKLILELVFKQLMSRQPNTEQVWCFCLIPPGRV